MEVTEFSKTIKARIRLLREFKGLKQQTVAERIGTTQQAYSLLERDKSNPRFETLVRFCEVIGVDITFLLAFDISVTSDTVERYGKSGFGSLVTAHEQMLADNQKKNRGPH